MPHCPKTKAGKQAGSADSKTAKVLAPEDVRAGDYVALLHVVQEMPTFMWCDGAGMIRPDEPVRMAFLPKNGGMPYRVRSICLPFILVKTPAGALRNLDVRRHRLARLDRAYAAVVWKACRKSRHKREHA